MRVEERVPLEVVRALDEDAVGAGRDHDGVRRPAFAREPQERPLRGEVAKHDRAVGAPGGEAALAGRGADREDGGSLPLEVVGLHHRRLGLGARPGPEPAGEVPVPVADDHRVAAEAELQRGQGSGAHLRDVGEPGLGPFERPSCRAAPLGAGHERGPPEADVGDLLPVAGAQRLEDRLGRRLPLRGLAHPGEHDLVVADEGGDERLALGGHLGDDLADRPLRGVDRDDALRPQVDVEVLQDLPLEHRPEAHQREGHAAVGGPGRERVPGEAREADVIGGALEAGERASRGASRRPRGGRRRGGRRASPRRGTSGTRRRRRRAASRAASLPARRPARSVPSLSPFAPRKRGIASAKMKTKMKRTLRMMKRPPKVITPGGAAVDELDARDPLGCGRHPLADADAGCGHGVRAPRGNACARGGTPPAPPRARKEATRASSAPRRRSRRAGAGSRP